MGPRGRKPPAMLMPRPGTVKSVWTPDGVLRRRSTPLGPGQVLVARAQDDRLVLDVVAHRDDTLRDPGERSGARVLREPRRAADGGRAVGARAAERPVATAPQMALLDLLLAGRG